MRQVVHRIYGVYCVGLLNHYHFIGAQWSGSRDAVGTTNQEKEKKNIRMAGHAMPVPIYGPLTVSQRPRTCATSECSIWLLSRLLTCTPICTSCIPVFKVNRLCCSCSLSMVLLGFSIRQVNFSTWQDFLRFLRIGFPLLRISPFKHWVH